MLSKLNILIAYPYFNSKLVEKLKLMSQDEYRLIIDSGAFTAWNTGKTITLDGYCKFLDSVDCFKPYHCVQLDVFGDPVNSWKNFLIMKQRGYNSMPVFTRGESLERLEEMYAETDYIMFGGIVIGGKNKNYVKWFLNRNKGRKCHWLGFTNMKFIKHYKPESVDSSSWNSERFGSLQLYKGGGEIKTFQKSDFSKKPTIEMYELFSRNNISLDWVKELGKNSSWSSKGPMFKGYSLSQFINGVTHVKRSLEVEEKIGTKMYLAVATDNQLNNLKEAYKFIREGKTYAR